MLAREFRRVFENPWALDGLEGRPATASTNGRAKTASKSATKSAAKTAKKATKTATKKVAKKAVRPPSGRGAS